MTGNWGPIVEISLRPSEAEIEISNTENPSVAPGGDGEKKNIREISNIGDL